MGLRDEDSYFTQATLDALGTIDDIPGVGDLEIPDGFLFSTKKTTKKSDGKATQNKVDAKSVATGPARTYAAYPAPPSTPQDQTPSQPVAGPSTIPGPSTLPGPSMLSIAPASPTSPTSPTSAVSMHSPSTLHFPMPPRMDGISLSTVMPTLPTFAHPDPTLSQMPLPDPLLSQLAVFQGLLPGNDLAAISPMHYAIARRASIDSSASRSGSDDSGYASVGLSTPSSTYSVPRATSTGMMSPDHHAVGHFQVPLSYPPAHSSSSSLAHALGGDPIVPLPMPMPPGGLPPKRRGEKTLAPLSTLRRPHPYKRDALDDKTLRKLETHTRGAQ
jgi:Gti1/Pac2 family transcription factor